MNDNAPAESSMAESKESTQDSATAAIDLDQLAERVYKLMREELRVERARGIGTSMSGGE